jgi:P4 family phage/plasmid primase-like protien
MQPANHHALDHALKLAAAGKPVFPCRPNKAPFVKGGFEAATTDEKQIRAWWAKHPSAMIGMPTGPASGVWALDIDAAKVGENKDGYASLEELTAKYGPLPATRTHKTAGGGTHYLFRYNGRDIRNSAGKVGVKIDVRGHGGYIIMPPSINAQGVPYAVTDQSPATEPPEWLLDLVAPIAKNSVNSATVNRRGNPYVTAAIRGELDEVTVSTPGSRNHMLNKAAFSLGQWVGGGELPENEARAMLFQAAQSCGLADSESVKTIESGLTKGIKSPRRAPEPQYHARPAASTETEAPKSPPLPTEDSLASLFTARYEGKFLFCHDTGAWYHWSGAHWQKDRMRDPLHLMRLLCREMNLDSKPVLGKLVTANGALHFAASDPKMKVTSEIWDADPMLIGTPGGVVDLRTGILSPANPEQRITKLTGVAPVDRADCPLWYRFLDDVTRQDKELQRFMQQIAGYCLSGLTREHALFFIYGPGGNGKSVFLNILNAVLKDYATTSAMTTFTASNSDQHPTDLAMLRGARLVSVSETEDGRAWAESRIKQLTGGDKITARFMRQDFFEYVPQFKLLIVGNHQPTLRNVDDAARRRFNIIPFIHRPEHPDNELEKKLMDELPAIFRWAIDGCIDWQSNGLVHPQSVIDATAEYFDSQDLFGRWLEECCERAPKDWTATRTLYDSWAKYAKSNGEEPGDVRKFGPLLSKAGFLPQQRTNTRGFKGLRLHRNEEWQDAYDK